MKELIINGRTLPIHFGIKVIHEYCKRNQVEFDQALQQDNPLSSLETLVSVTTIGLNEGARRSGSQERYTEDDVWDMIDERVQLIQEIGELLSEAIHPQVERLGTMAHHPNQSPTASRTQHKKKRHRTGR